MCNHVILNKKVYWGMSLSCSCEKLWQFKNVLTVYAMYMSLRYTHALTAGLCSVARQPCAMFELLSTLRIQNNPRVLRNRVLLYTPFGSK